MNYWGYLFLLIANVAGISKVVAMKSSGKVCSGEYNSIRINAFRALICCAVSVAVFLFSGAIAEWRYWWIWLISGLSNAVMMFVWILCTQRMSLVYVETFCLIGSTAIPLVIAPLLYADESVSLWQWIGVACLLLAVVVLSGKSKKKAVAEKTIEEGAENVAVSEETIAESGASERKKGLIITLVYVLLLILSNVGVSVTSKLYLAKLQKDSGYTPFFNLMTFVVVAACFCGTLLVGKAAKGQSLLPENASSGKKLVLYVSIAAVMIYVYQYFSALTNNALPSAVAYPLMRGVSMLLTVACDVCIFKQKMTKQSVVGLGLILLAIVLTNF